MRSCKKGFTLIELLFSVAIASTLIAVAIFLYDTIQRTGTRSFSANREWGVQQFIRGQFDAVDAGLNSYFAGFSGKPWQLSFITRNSAQFGKAQRPVMVVYRYNSSTNALEYQEVALPAWWDLNRTQYQGLLDSWRSPGYRESYNNVLLSNAENLRFSFWDASNKRWIDQWQDRAKLPPLARITWQHNIKTNELIIAPGVLSLSSVSGS